MSRRPPYIEKATGESGTTLGHLTVGETFICTNELYQVIKYKGDFAFVHLATGECISMSHESPVSPVDIQIIIHLNFDPK